MQNITKVNYYLVTFVKNLKMKDRLQMIMDHYRLNSSRLAEIMEIQRSGISHLLSGRNKPSYDFLVSLSREFPDLNIRWFITGTGDMLTGTGVIQEPWKIVFNEVTSLAEDISLPQYQPDRNPDKPDKVETEPEAAYGTSDRELKATKIVFFYPNGKFREYFPA